MLSSGAVAAIESLNCTPPTTIEASRMISPSELNQTTDSKSAFSGPELRMEPNSRSGVPGGLEKVISLLDP